MTRFFNRDCGGNVNGCRLRPLTSLVNSFFQQPGKLTSCLERRVCRIEKSGRRKGNQMRRVLLCSVGVLPFFAGAYTRLPPFTLAANVDQLREATIEPAALAGQTVGRDEFTPARALHTVQPAQPAVVPGGGEVLLEITVSATGQVRDINTVRTTPPFTALVVEAVRSWRFAPATLTKPKTTPRPIEGKVLVAAIFRPPTLYKAPTLGELPKDVGTPSNQIPFPTGMTTPAYPPQALFDGVVIVETTITAAGSVSEARVVGAGPGFEPVALDAAKQWRFRASVRDSVPTPAYAYLVFGFRTPVAIVR